MSNTAFIKVRRKLDYGQVTKDLQEINKRRFGGLFQIQEVEGGWNIVYDERPNGPIWSSCFWLENPRFISIGPRGRHWMFWVECEFTNELALKYDGHISDEGIGGQWKGEANKYPTVRSWFEMIEHDFVACGAEPNKQLLEMEMNLVPEAIKGIGR